jgi:uncharacterized caspase-like protein
MKRGIFIFRQLLLFAVILSSFLMPRYVSANQGAADKPRKAALLIGNGQYAGSLLLNPTRDVIAMASALERLGFKTTVLRDADFKTMVESIRNFDNETNAIDIRVIFYAGHGAQIRDRNYLVPIDTEIRDEQAIINRSIDLSELSERLSRAKTLNLLIIDACRDNPLPATRIAADGRRIKVRGQQHGLAPIRAPAGTFIAFSTSPGNVAADTPRSTNSLYAKHLLKHIGVPGITLEQLFKRVRVAVMQASNNQQTPWEESSLTVDFCLLPDRNGRCPGIAAP